ncbi:MAG TPA: site-2 protease family protein [Dermatophilaceae bacterium]|nr:site-2 protease family protein [Dermatophilaceae bacterium]
MPPAIQAPERAPGLRVATISGVPVYVGGSWAVLALLIIGLIGPGLAQDRPDLGILAYGVAALYALLLLVAVLVHEAAHAGAARAFGMPVHRVVADLWGGHTAFDAARSTPKTSAVVAVVGPLANLALAGLGRLLLPAFPTGVPNSLAGAFVLLNAALALFNLLPGLPLDGGQLVEAGVWKATGSRGKGRVAAGWCGRAVTLLVIGWFILRPLAQGDQVTLVDLAWAFFIASFLWAGATSAIRHGRAMQVIGSVRIADVLRPAVAMPPSATVADALAQPFPPVVLDERGIPAGVLAPADVDRVPVPDRAQATVGSVYRAQPDGWVVEADPSGSILPIIAALQRLDVGVVAVTHQGRLAGVVTAADVNAAVEHH